MRKKQLSNDQSKYHLSQKNEKGAGNNRKPHLGRRSTCFLFNFKEVFFIYVDKEIPPALKNGPTLGTRYTSKFHVYQIKVLSWKEER